MRKVVNSLVVFFAAVLVILPLVLFFAEKFIFISDTERALIHIVFVFSCFAGILTEADGKQLSIDVFLNKAPQKFKKIITGINSGVSIFTLTCLFSASFPNIFFVLTKGDSVWFVPIRFIFLALPIMYFGILFLQVKRSGSFAVIIPSFIFAFIASSGSVAAILYYFLGKEVSVFSHIYDFWCAFAGYAAAPLILAVSVLAFFGLPLFAVLSFIAYICFSLGGGYVDVIPNETYAILTDTSIAAIPLFTMAGYILAKGSAGERLLNFVRNGIGWLRGGVVIASVLVVTIFTTFTGASGITILALGGILSTIMAGSGYSKDDSESLITASGSIGILFPPSLAVIIYGVTNIMTVGIIDLFKGSVLPGMLMASAMIIVGIAKDKSEERAEFSPFSIGISFIHCIPELLLPVSIAILFFNGVFNLFQTAAYTAFYAFVLETFIRRNFTLKRALQIILECVPIAGGVLVIIGAAKGLAYFLVDANVPYILSDFVLNFVHSKYLFLLLLNILLLIVGCIMDLYSAILVVSPLIAPVAESFGLHPVHTGVIFLTNLALGFLTPPIGMNLFIAGYTFEKPVTHIVKKILPYLAIQAIILLLVTYIPWFSMALL